MALSLKHNDSLYHMHKIIMKDIYLKIILEDDDLIFRMNHEDDKILLLEDNSSLA